MLSTFSRTTNDKRKNVTKIRNFNRSMKYAQFYQQYNSRREIITI